MNLLWGILRTYMYAYFLATPPVKMHDKGLWGLYSLMYLVYFIIALSWHAWVRPDPVPDIYTWWLCAYLVVLPFFPAYILGWRVGVVYLMISTCEDVLKMAMTFVGLDLAHANSTILTVMDIYSLMVLLVVAVRVHAVYPPPNPPRRPKP